MWRAGGDKGKRHSTFGELRDGCLPAGSVDHAGVEGVANAPAQNAEHVGRPPIASRERPIELVRLK